MEDSYPLTSRKPAFDRILSYLSRRWVLIFSIGFGSLVILPFTAPLLMQVGLSGPARLVYLFYSFLCHQLPERSFFLFGPQTMYSLEELQKAGADTSNMFALRKFIGSPEQGWKVAWSDRMVWMYTSLWVFGMLWRPVLRKFNRLPYWGLGILMLPMIIDGSSHFISDLAGLNQGFRAENTWLAELTGHVFSTSFYAGDALGSFNSIMRLLTGILFGLSAIWFLFPYLEETMSLGQSDSRPPG